MKPNINTRYLSPKFFKLSKTTVVKGMQCALYLYLLKNKPKEKTPPDAATLLKFSEGRDFEAEFKARFSEGLDLSAALKKDVWSLGASFTEAVFDLKEEAVLFEACFIYKQTLVMTDVCVIEPDGTYTIYEVKNSTTIKDVFIQDSAIQYFNCQQAQSKLKAFNLVTHDDEGNFIITDISEQVKGLQPEIGENISSLLNTLKQEDPPEISMGTQCHKPYDCEYIAYCTKNNN